MILTLGLHFTLKNGALPPGIASMPRLQRSPAPWEPSPRLQIPIAIHTCQSIPRAVDRVNRSRVGGVDGGAIEIQRAADVECLTSTARQSANLQSTLGSDWFDWFLVGQPNGRSRSLHKRQFTIRHIDVD